LQFQAIKTAYSKSDNSKGKGSFSDDAQWYVMAVRFSYNTHIKEKMVLKIRERQRFK
jgi:hypothetical protein